MTYNNHFNSASPGYLEELIETFRKKNIAAHVAGDRSSALELVRCIVKPGATVAFAGSKTVTEIGARDFFLQGQNLYKIIDPYEVGITSAEAYERRRQALLADVLLTGSNAITLEGHIVNMDNQGNRVAGICFGPQKVIIVVGINKIVTNDHEARKRISDIAAPLNSKRLNKGNPCEKTGKCEKCRLNTRICRSYSIIDGQTKKDRINIIIVKENLGF